MTNEMKLARMLSDSEERHDRILARFSKEAFDLKGVGEVAKKGWGAVKNSTPGQRALGGAVVGGIVGNRMSGGQTTDWDGNPKKKSRIGGTLAGAAIGAAGGALTHGGARAAVAKKIMDAKDGVFKKQSSRVDLLRAEMDKQANLWGSIGSAAANAFNKAGPTIAKGLTAVKNSPTATRALVGAGAGAMGGVVKHVFAPKDAQGKRQGSLGSRVLGGAAVGTLGGLASKSIAEHALNSRPVKDAMYGNYGKPKMLPVSSGPAAGQTVDAVR